MSSRAWIAAVVFGVATLAGEALAQNADGVAGNGPAIEDGGGENAQPNAQAERDFSFPVRIVEDPKETKRAERRAKNAAKREKRDLAAQQSMAESTEQIIVISWWQIGLGTLGTLAVAAALGIALHANWIARDTARRQLRAYVVLKGGALRDFGIGQNPEAVVSIINSGQTPAYGVETRLFIASGPYPPLTGAAFPPPPDLVERGSKGVLGPGIPVSVNVKMKDGQLTNEEAAGVIIGSRALYIVGDVRYRDAFGKARTMQFRTMFTHRSVVRGSEDIEICDEGNEAD